MDSSVLQNGGDQDVSYFKLGWFLLDFADWSQEKKINYFMINDTLQLACSI
jgi:hypothetical protein